MKFEEVLPALREGKKIRRTFWNPKHYIELKGIHIYDNDTCKDYNFNRYDFTCDNWKIYQESLLTEEEKTFIKNILSFANDETITRICFDYQPEIERTLIFFETEGLVTKCFYWTLRPSYFHNFVICLHYTFKDLGLVD